jgi:hypothetical protein
VGTLSLSKPSLHLLSTKTLNPRRPFFPQIQTRRRDVDTGRGGATSLLGSVSPCSVPAMLAWLGSFPALLRSVSVSPPGSFSALCSGGGSVVVCALALVMAPSRFWLTLPRWF